MAQTFCKKVNESSNPLEHEGKKISVKNARTELQKSRNYALRDACKLIEQSGESNGKKVEIVWKVLDSKSRQVTVNDIVAFIQTKDDAQGSFTAPYTALVLS